jgi:tRNA dimethylallyltransferase
MEKVLIVVGPTASGKSDLAIALAKKFNGEIINADAFQVYKELFIGTGRLSEVEKAQATFYLEGEKSIYDN